MPDFTVSVDYRDVQRKLSAFAEKQLPYALSLAINDLAFQLMRAENDHISQVFRHPRPFTQRATQVEKTGSKGSPVATVSVRADRQRYLAPYEFGGQHVLLRGELYEPKAARTDQYGQLSKNQVAQVLSRRDVFRGKVNGIDGIWQRLPRHKLRLLLRIGNDRPVTMHLAWLDNAQHMLAAQWPKAFETAMTKAIETAKL